MMFATLPVDQAGGGVLAHTVHGDGLTLSKGHPLSDRDLARLRAAGIRHVTVARLEDGDVDENTMARRVAGLLGGAHIGLRGPAKGRVHVLARVPGLVRLDRPRLDALNRVDEGLALATLPPLARAEGGEVIATLKVIPFALPHAVFEQAAQVLGGDGPALEIAPFRSKTVALIQTRHAGRERSSALDKTRRLLQKRIEARTGRLSTSEVCDHDTGRVAAALTACLATAPDLVLVQGASATSDRRDILPSAIGAAGGRIVRLGMPVDPGNLLLLAEIGGKPVVGVPGCARSPALNGFDWVLDRLFADCPLTGADIAAMGVGGLLQGGRESETVPFPRGGGRR